jgi:hypothetical protein
MKYRRKPVYVEAVEYTDPSSVHKIFDMLGSSKGINNSDEGLYIFTPDLSFKAKKGDYVVKGMAGGISVFHPEIFEATYEAV